MRFPRFVPLCLSGFAVTVCVLFPLSSYATAQDVVRVGDRDMSCTALAAEINTLGQPAEAAPAPRKKHGFGLLKVLSVAVPMVGVTQALGGALLSSGVGAAQAAAAEGDGKAARDDARRMTAEAMNGGSAAQQRKERLMTIFELKRC